MRNLTITLSLLFLVGLACQAPEEAKTPEKPAGTAQPPDTPVKTDETAAKETATDISWKEIDAIYNLKSKKTDAQKAALWDDYKDKTVSWQGEVTDIQEGFLSGFNLFIKMNRSTLTHDLMIGLDDSQKEAVLNISKGDKIKFTGKLNQWGSILSISLSDGVIEK